MKEFFTVLGVNRRCPFLAVLLLCLLLAGACRQKEETLRIVFTGDLLLDRGVRTQIERYGIDTLFSSVSPLFRQCDNVVVNLECPITTRQTPLNKRFIFRGEPEWLPTLRRAGITHAALANNHTNDQGRKGLEDTYNNLIVNNIVPFGAGANAEKAAMPVCIKKGNMEIALFNVLGLPLENWVWLADSYGPCQSSMEELCKQIRRFKRKSPRSFVVVILHWGVEYATTPYPLQRKQAHQLIDFGADAIIGHHPHVIQPVEFYKEKPVFYSLGNFIFDSKRPEAQRGLIADLTFTRQGIKVQSHEFTIRGCWPVISFIPNRN